MPRGTVVTRFAPSPTGQLHMGGVRTALFAYLFARQNGGKFILRIEDTDRERSTKEFEQAILDGMKWLGLGYDEFYRQSERGELYKKFLKQLVDAGTAFVSKGEGSEGKRAEVIRFRNPNKKVTFSDLIRGEITFDTTDLGDFVIAKSMEEPVFHLAVSVDDAEMGITHVIRGEDHISNTPRQILIQEALGLPRPVYAHLPLVLASDRTKLSKRKHGEMVSLPYYKTAGYLPEAILNFLALIGWNPGDNREIFSLAELVKEFDFSKIQKGGAVFNVEKLDWVNKEYLKKMPDVSNRISAEVEKLLGCGTDERTQAVLARVAPVVLERISKFGDLKNLAANGELDFFFRPPVWQKEKFLWKGQGSFLEIRKHLLKTVELISALSSEPIDKGEIKEAVWPYAETVGRGNVLWPVRYALSGLEKSPDPFTIIEVIGREEGLRRLNKAAAFLEK